MLLTSAAAKDLAAIIVLSTQGEDVLVPQLPLHVEDRGDNWLVKGTPYTDAKRQADHIMFHVFLRKDSAEVTGIDFAARMMFAPEVMAQWRRKMSVKDYALVFGPKTRFEPDGILDMYYALYGGLINKPADAVDYAAVLLQTSPAFAGIAKADLAAVEQDKVWHVTAKGAEILSVSRSTGKVLSGGL